jgi:hypothetical protein
MIPYKDLGDEPEDERIRQIGEKVMGEKLTVGFIVDDEPGKPDRYATKLKERFPGIRVMHQSPGLVPKTVFVKVGPPVN